MPSVYNRRYLGAPEAAVSIERPGPWGNPFRAEDYGRRECIARYRRWILEDAQRLSEVREALAGRDLVCCCKPRECHGDVLLELANLDELI